MPCSAVELWQLEGCRVLGTVLPTTATGARRSGGQSLCLLCHEVHGWAGSRGMVGLSPFSISLSLELRGLMPCFCPALGLALVKPGPAQSMLCWAEALPWMDPEVQEVSAGQLCTAPASSLAFGALVVGPAFCTLEARPSPALCPAPSTPGQPCATTARATTTARRTRTRQTSVWSKGCYQQAPVTATARVSHAQGRLC